MDDKKELEVPAAEEESLELGDDLDLSEFEVVEEEEISFSEDEAKYANGFPEWDLVPPKK